MKGDRQKCCVQSGVAAVDGEASSVILAKCQERLNISNCSTVVQRLNHECMLITALPTDLCRYAHGCFCIPGVMLSEPSMSRSTGSSILKR